MVNCQNDIMVIGDTKNYREVKMCMMRKLFCKILSFLVLLSVVNMTVGGIGFAEDVIKDAGFEVATTIADYAVGYPVYTTAANTALNSFLPLQNIKVTVKAKRTATGSQNLSVITALYSPDHTLQEVAVTEDSLNGMEEKDIVVNMTLPATTTNSHYLKTFVWDGENTMKPLNEAFSYPNNTGWNITAGFTTDFSEYRSGNASLCVTGGKSGTAWQEFSVLPNSAYKLSYYAKGNINFNVKVTDPSGNLLGTDGVDNTNGSTTYTEWTNQSFIFLTGNNNRVRIYFTNVGADGTVSYIDDIELTDNLLTNPGMEDGTNGWAPIGTSENLSVRSETTKVHTGSAALAVTGRSATTDGAQQDITSILTAAGQGQYILESWQMMSIATEFSRVTMNIKINDSAGERIMSLPTSTIVNNTTWTHVSTVRNITWSGTLNSAILYFDAQANYGEIYLDDCRLARVPENIVMNGGFESGISNWALGTNFEVTTDEKMEGSHSLKITANNATQIAYQELPVEPNTDYNMSFSGKGSEKIIYKITDVTGNTVLASEETTSASTWTKSYLSFNSGTNSKVRVCFQATSSSGAVSYVDNVKLAKSMNLIVNPGFENGTSQWTTYGTVTLGTTTTGVFAGTQSGSATNRNNRYSNIIQIITQQINEFGPGTYKVSGWVKTSGGTGTSMYIRVKLYAGGAEQVFNVLKTLPTASEWNSWTNLSGMVTLDWSNIGNKDGVLTRAEIYAEYADSSSPAPDYFIDEFSLVKMP